jgi:hypothetical protein
MQREGGYGEEPFIAIPPGVDEPAKPYPEKAHEG